MLKKITSILCVLLGIAVIVLGLTFDTNVSKHDVDEKSFRISSNTYDLDYASFGADFYTYIYRGSDTIVDVLDEMNKSTETIVKAENGIYYITAGTNAYLSAKVIDSIDLGTHTMFIADVQDAVVLNSDPSATYAYYHAHIKPKKKAAPTEGGKPVWVCKICGYVYEGDPIPADFICPLCKHPASDFERAIQ